MFSSCLELGAREISSSKYLAFGVPKDSQIRNKFDISKIFRIDAYAISARISFEYLRKWGKI